MPIAVIKKFSCATLGLLLGAAHVCAGDYSGSAVGTSAGKFLSFGSSARAAGMGEAYCAAAQAADAVRYNPAAMLRADGNSVEVMHANYLAGTFLDQAAFAHSLGASQAIGISALQMSYGSIAETDETGYQTGTAQPANLALTGAYAYKLESLGGSAIGVSASYVRSTIVTSANTFTAALGLLSQPFGPKDIQLALVAENLMGSLKFDQKADPLPMAFKLGGLMRLQSEWVLSLDLVAPKDNLSYLAIGTEKWFKTRSATKLAVRAGYNMRAARDIGGSAGIATGLGILFNSLTLDYALILFGDIGYTHKLALGFKFGKGGARTAERLPKPALEKAMPVQEEPDEADLPELPKIAVCESCLETADASFAEKDYPGAGEKYGEALKTLPETDNRRVYVYERQGQIAIKGKNTLKAKNFFLAAVETAKKLAVNNVSVVNAYLGLAYCFEKSANVPAAVKNYEKALTLSENTKTRAGIRKNIQRLKAETKSE